MCVYERIVLERVVACCDQFFDRPCYPLLVGSFFFATFSDRLKQQSRQEVMAARKKLRQYRHVNEALLASRQQVLSKLEALRKRLGLHGGSGVLFFFFFEALAFTFHPSPLWSCGLTLTCTLKLHTLWIQKML